MAPVFVIVPLAILAALLLSRSASGLVLGRGGYSGTSQYYGREVFLDRPAGARGTLLYFHGNGADVRVVGPALAAITRVRKLALVVPQLGPSGQLGDLGTAQQLAKLLAWVPGASLGPLVVAAHSGGFGGAIVAVGLAPRAVVLLDALYAGDATFEAYAVTDAWRRLGNVYGPTTSEASLMLAKRLAARLGAQALLDTTGAEPSATELRGRRATTFASTVSHSTVPVAYLGRFLDAYA